MQSHQDNSSIAQGEGKKPQENQLTTRISKAARYGALGILSGVAVSSLVLTMDGVKKVEIDCSEDILMRVQCSILFAPTFISTAATMGLTALTTFSGLLTAVTAIIPIAGSYTKAPILLASAGAVYGFFSGSKSKSKSESESDLDIDYNKEYGVVAEKPSFGSGF